MKSKEVLQTISILLRYIGGALLAVALFRVLVVPIWASTDGGEYACGRDWGGVLTVDRGPSTCAAGEAVRVYASAMWAGLGIGMWLAGNAIRDSLIGHD